MGDELSGLTVSIVTVLPGDGRRTLPCRGRGPILGSRFPSFR